MTGDVDWEDEKCPRCGIPRRDHPECRFRKGLFCVNDPCPNPHHRRATPEPREMDW